MSTKKTASSSSRKTTPPAAAKSSANGRPAKALAKPAPGARPLAHLHIGEVAGEVWALLAESDGQTLAAIKKSIDAPADLVVAAVGWLAREDKLAFTTSGRTVKLALKP
jgi:hypothetical protein